jgi:hypothetical protein
MGTWAWATESGDRSASFRFSIDGKYLYQSGVASTKTSRSERGMATFSEDGTFTLHPESAGVSDGVLDAKTGKVVYGLTRNLAPSEMQPTVFRWELREGGVIVGQGRTRLLYIGTDERNMIKYLRESSTPRFFNP